MLTYVYTTVFTTVFTAGLSTFRCSSEIPTPWNPCPANSVFLYRLHDFFQSVLVCANPGFCDVFLRVWCFCVCALGLSWSFAFRATLHCLYYWQHYTVFTTGPLHSVQHLPCTLSNCVCVCVRACVGACACACACVHASFDGWPCSAVVYADSVSYIPSW